jgi:iron complex transport system substrate-binding protein|uniref:ABC transporter substrate-binding protein n=1 Tax=Candidatus Planktophila sp. TaxID=2175601 RepID=UPI00404AB60A
MFKRFTRPTALLVTALLLAPLAPVNAASTATKYPLIISSGGYSTTIAKKPTRIISLSPSATESLFQIGAGKQVLAVDSLSNFPKSAPITELSAFEPNVEAIIALKPDLVVLSVDAMKSMVVKEALEKLKIPVLMEKAPGNLAQAYKEIEILGAVTDRTSEAKRVTFKMAALIKSILNRAKVSGKVTFFHELDNTLYSVTSDTFIGKVYKDFGLINIADKAAGADSYGYPQLSAEYLVKSDPAIIFLADAEYGESAATVKARAGWSGITAVTKKNVFALPNDIPSRWGPRLVDFYRYVAACLTKVKK